MCESVVLVCRAFPNVVVVIPALGQTSFSPVNVFFVFFSKCLNTLAFSPVPQLVATYDCPLCVFPPPFLQLQARRILSRRPHGSVFGCDDVEALYSVMLDFEICI